MESTPRGSWGSILGKLGATCKFIPFEKKPEGGDENGVGGGGAGQGGQGSFWEREGLG